MQETPFYLCQGEVSKPGQGHCCLVASRACLSPACPHVRGWLSLTSYSQRQLVPMPLATLSPHGNTYCDVSQL